MFKRTLATTLLTILVTALSGCVSIGDFEEYVAEMEQKHMDADLAFRILLCESRNDAYQDMMESDEPNPTRRDEPSSTRREEACLEEFDDIYGANLEACREDMLSCVETGLGAADCRACYRDCLTSGTWDNGACPIP